MDPSQRAAGALALLPLLESEAKERRGARNDIQQKFAESSRGQARDKAAVLTGANHAYVSEAKRIVQKDSKMLQRLRDGEITIQEAKRQLGFQQSKCATVPY
jgi:hypothetical protein